MSTPSSIVIGTSTFEPAARCVVCGNEIAAGEGLTARFGQRTLRFKCPGCLARFESDPDRYLDEFKRSPEAYTGTDPDEYPRADTSPCSEWTCY